ncbi:hypothetical protein IPL85_02260 [Candidatus Saccharibacteria bacterium]|nr:MAG: hypothetical protein IPL85_02260 [Candidatus Saccharibacteria bacterium]
MFNQFGQQRSKTPGNQPRRVPSNAGAPNSSTRNSFSAQIRPDFLHPSPSAGSVRAQSTNRMQRIKPDDFQRLTPSAQRAALFDQAHQHTTQARQMHYGTLRNPSLALPGGLSEQQHRDFKMLQRIDPVAAQNKLMHYHHTADVRYNKPGTTPKPPAGSGLTYRRPPTNNSNSSRRSFGK